MREAESVLKVAAPVLAMGKTSAYGGLGRRPNSCFSSALVSRGRTLISMALLFFLTLSTPCAVCVRADDSSSIYHTPLAGEAGEVVFMGEKVTIPPLDRSDMTSITLGASLLTPQQGGTTALPVAVFYHRRIKDDFRARYTVSLFVNELEYDRNLGGVELVTHFENYTLPVQQSEVLQGSEMKGTSLYWGTLLGSVGVGWRIPVHPLEVDNDLRLQLLGRVGYFYAKSGSDTAADLSVPNDTMLYGARGRVHYDTMRRNLLELPHKGFAAGGDLDFMHRDRWRDQTATTTLDGNRDYLQLSGYLVGAAGIPGRSERDRLIYCAYAGHTFNNNGDRFNAFRLNGASFPSEADDVVRPHYTGIIYDNIPVTSYATVSAGYRRELTFFLYLSLYGSYIWADRATVEGASRVAFHGKEGGAGTITLDSAFLWDSSFYLAYTWESGMIRNGRSGGGYTVMWNKLF
ncbi:porin [Citrifermentans pelophilum]|nr:porin [Geoanaerobacter pelophilus]